MENKYAPIALGLATPLFLLQANHSSSLSSLRSELPFPPSAPKNYPVILIHGYCGCTMDENPILQGYFHYAFTDEAHGGKVSVYEADISPAGSAHDRACELWQQIVGFKKVKQIAEKKGCSVAEVVYGKEHVKKYHRDTVYKPKYLKTNVKGRMYAFPDGLPGFGKEMKVHLMGHSMGGLTARHF